MTRHGSLRREAAGFNAQLVAANPDAPSRGTRLAVGALAAGKTELLAVLLSRREVSTLALRRLELVQRSWLLVADYVEITGDLP